MSSITRRRFIALTSGAAAGAILFPRGIAAANNGAEEKIAWFVIGDTHYLANKESPRELDEVSHKYTSGLIEQLNRLPGTQIPPAAGGGNVAAIRGVIHAGDITDTGRTAGANFQLMASTELDSFRRDFGLTGSDGKLKVPVFELHGNHDAPDGKGPIIDCIIERNKRRPGLTRVSANGLHYSWDWGGAHFVNLGIVVGQVKSVTRQRRYAPLDSLEFLISDLAESVGSTGRPVFITHHVDIARYTGPCDPAGPDVAREWDPCDVRAFYEALNGYRVHGIFYGHTHVRNIFRWDGVTAKAEKGIPVFNTDNVSHFRSDEQAFFYCELNSRGLLVREFATKDGWTTGEWTPSSWQVEAASVA